MRGQGHRRVHVFFCHSIRREAKGVPTNAVHGKLVMGACRSSVLIPSVFLNKKLRVSYGQEMGPKLAK